MGREEVIDLLKENPRLTTRQISEELNKSIKNMSKMLNKMLRTGELKSHRPNKKEITFILKNYPNSIHALNLIKVFEVNLKW